MPELHQMIMISFFATPILLLIYKTIQWSKESKRYPPNDRWKGPKAGDGYVVEVYTKTAFGGGRTLSITFHPTLDEANLIAKKHAQWYDDWGKIHPDVGIYWWVGLIANMEKKDYE